MEVGIQDSAQPRGESRSLPVAVTNERLARLAQIEPVSSVSPHHVLTEGVWLSTEPDKGAELSVMPSETGFALRLGTAGKSRWVTLSFTLPLEALHSGLHPTPHHVSRIGSVGVREVRSAPRRLRRASAS